MGEVAAGGRGAQLVLDVGREAAAAVVALEAGEEGLEVGAQDALEGATGGVPPQDVGRAGVVVVGIAVGASDPGARGLVQLGEDGGAG